jgi:hypothetical protein
MIELRTKFKSSCLRFALLIVACALLPKFARAVNPPDRAPTLVDEASAQFQLAYRLHPAEGHHRQEQLDAVVAAWRAAPHSETNDVHLNSWVRAAIRASMPGSREALPAMPDFTGDSTKADRAKGSAEKTPANFRTPEPTPATILLNSPPDESILDPFRDDP